MGRAATGRTLPALTNADIHGLLDAEEIAGGRMDGSTCRQRLAGLQHGRPILVDEPDGCEIWLENWAMGKSPMPRHWTDSYLAAFARVGGLLAEGFRLEFALDGPEHRCFSENLNTSKGLGLLQRSTTAIAEVNQRIEHPE